MLHPDGTSGINDDDDGSCDDGISDDDDSSGDDGTNAPHYRGVGKWQLRWQYDSNTTNHAHSQRNTIPVYFAQATISYQVSLRNDH
jgi:hypothetical protein